jgi:hypothetical protein
MAADPAWVAPVAAVGGALLVAVLNIRQQRSQHLREKMLDAADAFQTSAQAASTALLRIARDSESAGETESLSESVKTALEDADTSVARLTLLFGPASKTVEQAIEAHLRLDTTFRWKVPHFLASQREHEDDSDSVSEEQLDELRNEITQLWGLADEYLRAFARAAFSGMRSPGRTRVLTGLRDPLRRRLWSFRPPRQAWKRWRRPDEYFKALGQEPDETDQSTSP